MVIGGYHGSGHGTAGTEILEMRCNIRSYPYPLYRHSATVIPTGILVCGGTSGSSSRYNKCYQYKQSTSSWDPFPSMTTGRYDFDMKYLNQGIWAMGGHGSSGSRLTMDYFNMTSNRWTKRSLPFQIYDHCVSQISEYELILLGGSQSGYGVSDL